ncbi:MAG: hypothetical protein WCA27_07295 [Candidatus Sulfotelmatobacter sp.]
MRTSITDVTYTSVRTPSGRICDRLVIEGRRVKVLRREDTFKDLMVGVRQLSALVRAGWQFDEVWVECFPDEEREA